MSTQPINQPKSKDGMGRVSPHTPEAKRVNKNIKVNKDGTVSPIDPSKPSSYSNLSFEPTDTSQEGVVRAILLSMEWCHAVKTSSLEKATQQILALLADVEKAREIFVPIHGTEGRYEVSNFGSVRSVPGGRRKGALLKQSCRKQNYKSVTLWKGKKFQSENVHRLVALAFLSNPENKPCINHKDGNGGNNHVDNLEWCTYSKNTRYLKPDDPMDKSEVVFTDLPTKEKK